jgi:hypothetical protein
VVCGGIGFALAAILAVFKSLRRPKNLWFMLAYLFGAVICFLLFLGGLSLCGWIEERTHYASRAGIIFGAVFPGFICLSIIPNFVSIARKQTSGIHVD